MQKKIIIALIVLGIIISILINNKISEARIQNILNLTSNNNTSEYFKKLISENENIDYNIIDNLKDISKLKEKINNEITKYTFEDVLKAFFMAENIYLTEDTADELVRAYANKNMSFDLCEISGIEYKVEMEE